ncbi:hypothetical protein [uncultured Chryseobacterium sp.]|jgi:hypothetical protein|uniref:hypothetical protein n=1 Tax=uncultured Chryseobacterium sp. TaxID=259322 RepID=UPI0026176249|nr:hypothetical protein [uncultured Chryseobacterium sp.]
MTKLKFKKISIAPVIFILGCLSLFLPYAFLSETNLLTKGHFLWLFYFELLFLFTIFFLWYKIYYEIIFARVENNILYYRRLFFIKKTIKIEDIKGFKVGSEESDFLVLYDKEDKKLFVIRMDFYSNYYDFIDEIKAKDIGIYYTIFQRIIKKIFRKKIN